MKIGLYFGSFNPIHTGHCIIASYVVNNTELDQVWLVVTPQNPFKASNSLLNEYHRFHLVQAALEGETVLKATDIEFHLPKPSYTANTLVYLHEKYPQNQFAIIMGSDSFQNLPKWKNAAAIINHYFIYVYIRPGYPINNDFIKNVHILEAPLLDISSTRIRDYVRQKKSISFLVPDKVKAEIENNGYYR